LNKLIEAFESLRSRADLAILALRRGDKEAAVREIDAAVDELREAVREEGVEQ